jgi:Na+/melibiose symporter-like transporter
LVIFIWSFTTAAAYFLLAKYFGFLRVSEETEILGCDIYYFGPMDMIGNISDYDTIEGLLKIVPKNIEI